MRARVTVSSLVVVLGPLGLACAAGGDDAPPGGDDAGAMDAGAGSAGDDVATGPSAPDDGVVTGSDPAEESGAQASGDQTGDPSSDSGAPIDPVCPPQAVFCESFEEGIDPGTWEVGGVPGGVVLETRAGFDGAQSLHVRIGAEYGIDGASTARLLVGVPAPEDRIYARWYMRFGDMSLPGYHPNLVHVTGPDYDIGHWEDFATISFGTFLSELSVNAFGLGLDGAKLWTERGNEVLPDFGGDTTPRSEHHIGAGQWFCVEWMLFGDHQSPDDTSHPGEEDRVWIDGVEIPELLGNDELWGPWGAPEHWSPLYDGSIWTFGIGGIYPAGPSLDVWFDAIAFANEPIGCAEIDR
jgi:hypothetical protein